MKNLRIYEDWTGNLVFEECLSNIEELNIDITEESLKVTMKTGFSKFFSIRDNGFEYSFRIE